VPAAAPVPRGPSVLTLYSAADLLTGPGCPVCRYAAEASDRYLRWFALEGHAQPETITRLCASLGMCARHTRALMGQPGAAIRLTAVYRYIMTAARDRLAGRVTTLAACPACEHDGAASCRALDTLLEGLADGEAMDRCRELGGLCIPHLGEAAAQAQRTVVTWLTETMRETVAARPARPEWLAGTDHDAEVRAVLRQALPATGMPGSGACSACLAAAQSERDSLAQLPGLTGASAGDPDPGLALCAGHLAVCGCRRIRRRLAGAAGLAGRMPGLGCAAATTSGQAGHPQSGRLAADRTPTSGPFPRMRRLPGTQRCRPARARRSPRRSARITASVASSGSAVRPASSHPAGSRPMGRPGNGRRRGRACRPADRRAGRSVPAEHLGAPPRRTRPGIRCVAARRGVPGRRRLRRVPSASALTRGGIPGLPRHTGVAAGKHGRALAHRQPTLGPAATGRSLAAGVTSILR